MFFDKNDRVHQAMRHVADMLAEAQIPYAIAGGMAVNAHCQERTTGDVDFLLTPSGFQALIQQFVPHDFHRVSGHARRFVDGATGVSFSILIMGMFPGSGRPGPVAFPDPTTASELIENRSVLKLKDLIELKLAARRYKDFGDVVELIRIHNLDESFAATINPTVHADFIECLEEKRREDEYEARQDQEVEKQFPPDASSTTS